MADTPSVKLPQIPFLFTPQSNLLAAGMPDEQGLRQAAEFGVKTVINLCPATETPITEPGTVTELGMEYVSIPVAGPADLSLENAKKLAQAMSDTSRKTLVHCRSSNRVGALIALKAYWLDGKPPSEAVDLGRAAGLTKLEEVVIYIMNNS